MPQYELAAEQEAARLDAEAEVSAAVVEKHPARIELHPRRRAVLGRALLRSMSTKLATPRLRSLTLAVGCAVFLGTVLWLATQPVSVAV